jgi:hypothetical protein
MGGSGALSCTKSSRKPGSSRGLKIPAAPPRAQLPPGTTATTRQRARALLNNPTPLTELLTDATGCSP